MDYQLKAPFFLKKKRALTTLISCLHITIGA